MKSVSDVFCSSAPRSSLIAFLLRHPVFFWNPHQWEWGIEDWTTMRRRRIWWQDTLWTLMKTLITRRPNEEETEPRWTLTRHLSPLEPGLFFSIRPAPLGPPKHTLPSSCRPNRPEELTAVEKGGGRGERGELHLLRHPGLRMITILLRLPVFTHDEFRQWWNRHSDTHTTTTFPQKLTSARIFSLTSPTLFDFESAF